MRSRCARSAAVSRSASSSSPIRPASRLTAVATSRTSDGPAGVARAARSPLPSRCAVSARSVTGRVSERASRSATPSASRSSTRPSPPSTSQVRVTPARNCSAGTNTSMNAVPPSARRTGWTRRVPSSLSMVTAVDGRVGRRRSSRVAEPRAVGPAHAHAGVARGADQGGGDLLLVVEADRRGEELQLRPRRVEGPRLGHPGHQRRGGQQEGEQHDRRRGRHQQGDLAPHDSGSASRTPTPRTVCSSRGAAARLAELAAQPGQVDVDGLVRPAVGELPHLAQQLALGDDRADTRRQVGEQVELLRRQLHRPSRRASPGGRAGRPSGRRRSPVPWRRRRPRRPAGAPPGSAPRAGRPGTA